MRKSLRQIIRKQPKCANCYVNCLEDGKRAFSDALLQFLPVRSSETVYSFNEIDVKSLDQSGHQANEAGNAQEDPIDVGGEELFGDGGRLRRTKATTTVMDALFKLFAKAWGSEKELLGSTLKDKEKLVLCDECAWCLSQLYNWYSRFVKLALDSRKSYLYTVVRHTRHDSVLTRHKGTTEAEDKEKETDISLHIDTLSIPATIQEKLSKLRKAKIILERTTIDSLVEKKRQEGDASKSKGIKPKRKILEHVEPSDAISFKVKEEVNENPDSSFDLLDTEQDFDAEQQGGSCAICQKDFPDRMRLHKHLQSKKHKDKISSKPEPEMAMDSDLDFYPDEDKRITTPTNKTKSPSALIRKHQKKKKQIKAKVTATGIHTGHSRKQPNGNRKRRKPEIRYLCSEEGCRCEFHLKEDYLDHLASLHGKIDVELIEIQGPENLNRCPICRARFLSPEALETHLEKKHVPRVLTRDHPCEDCGKNFLSRHDLKTHMANHSLPMSYVCEKCPFRTRRPQELERHGKLVHLQEKNFFCDICNKGYALKWQLTSHSRIHKEERLFLCTAEGCGKTFRTPSNLRQHQELHKGSKYVCHICGQSYSRKAYLRLHLNGTHLNLPLPPSTKRDRAPSMPKRPRLKLNKARKVKSRSDSCSKEPDKTTAHYQYLPGSKDTKHEELVMLNSEGATEDEDGVLILEEYDDEVVSDFVVNEEEEDEDEEGTIHVRLDLDRPEVVMTEEPVGQGVETGHFALSDGQQILCYPVASLGMVQRFPVAIATGGGNTYYIATAPVQQSEEDDPQALSVFNPFTEFMGIQQ